jgi:hypothetical protein
MPTSFLRFACVASCTGACTRETSPPAGRDAVMAAHEGKVALISATAIWRGLVTIVGRVKPRLVIIVSLADVFAGNEKCAAVRWWLGPRRGCCLLSGPRNSCKTKIWGRQYPPYRKSEAGPLPESIRCLIFGARPSSRQELTPGSALSPIRSHPAPRQSVGLSRRRSSMPLFPIPPSPASRIRAKWQRCRF